MKMPNITPGPWEIIEKPDPKMISDWSIKIGDKSINFFPYVYHYADESKTSGGYVSCPEQRANATAIAALPDLLEAARDALSGWRYIRDTHGDLYGVGWDRVEEKLKAALLKAGCTDA